VWVPGAVFNEFAGAAIEMVPDRDSGYFGHSGLVRLKPLRKL
jgi:hypothetical protein